MTRTQKNMLPGQEGKPGNYGAKFFGKKPPVDNGIAAVPGQGTKGKYNEDGTG